MICPNCSSEIQQNDLFCNKCGAKQFTKIKKEPKSSNLYGILSSVFSAVPTVSILGIIFGIIGIVQGTKCKNKNSTPLALSIIGTVHSIVVFIQYLSVVLYFVFYFGLYFLMIIIMLITMPGADAPNVDKFFM